MRDRHYKLTPEPLSEEARNILTGGRDEMIRDATARAARISDSTHQGHILEEPESKFEADIQDILGLLMQAEGEYHQGHFPMVLALVKDVRRKLVILVNEERGRKE